MATGHETAKATIKKVSYPLLDEVASVVSSRRTAPLVAWLVLRNIS